MKVHQSLAPYYKDYTNRNKMREKAKRILIVDDQIFNIQAAKAILEHKLSISTEICDFALNGIQAYELIQEDVKKIRASPVRAKGHSDRKEFSPENVPSSYSLILMDCNMPFMDGFECTQKIRHFFWKRFGASVYE